MQEKRYICDACKQEYKPESVVPVKRGEVVNQIVIRVYDVQHPKDVSPTMFVMFENLPPGLDLCPRCEGTIKRFLNLK